MTPDILKSQSESTELTNGEEAKHAIYEILREG